MKFIRSYWLVIGLCSMIFAAAGVGVSFLFPRVYRAEALLAPSNVMGEPGSGIDSLIGRYGAIAGAVGIGLPGGDKSTQIAIARLRSRGFVEAFIKEEGIAPILFPDEPIVEAEQVTQDKSGRTLQDAYRKFVERVMLVKHDKMADLVTIRIDWTDRHLAAAWANKLVQRLNEAMRAEAIEETQRSISYLRTELERADYVKLKDSISSLLETQINKRMLAVTQPDYSFRIVDRAKAPDANKKVSPKRIVFLLIGGILGFISGCLIALAKHSKKVGHER